MLNGRVANVDPRHVQPRYFSAKAQLHKLWQEHGHERFFYDAFYLPTAQNLTQMRVGRAGMPIAEIRRAADGAAEVKLRTLSAGGAVHYTVDGSAPTAAAAVAHADTAVRLAAHEQLRARAFAAGARGPSRELALNGSSVLVL